MVAQLRRVPSFVAAAQALALIARDVDGIVSSGRLAIRIGTNPVVVRRTLGRLRMNGIVDARAGREGGWALTRDAARIGLGDVHRALYSRRGLAAWAVLDRALTEADAAYAACLDSWTVADLAKGIPPPTPAQQLELQKRADLW